MGINQIRNSKNLALSDLSDVVAGASNGQALIYRSGTEDWSGANINDSGSIATISGYVDTISGYASGIEVYASGISGLASGTDRRTQGISGSTLIYPTNTTALNWANRQLIADNGITPILSWVSSGYANFFSNNIITSGLVNGSNISGMSGTINTLSGYISGISGYASTISGLVSGNTNEIVNNSGYINTISGLVSGISNLTVGISGYVLSDILGSGSINWNNRILYDSSELESINYDARTFKDLAGNIVLNYTSSTSLNDTISGNSSVLWSDRVLIDSTGSIASIDWANRTLTDSISGTSVDWQNRILYASNGITPSINYATSGLANFYSNNLTTSGAFIGGYCLLNQQSDNSGIRINAFTGTANAIIAHTASAFSILSTNALTMQSTASYFSIGSNNSDAYFKIGDSLGAKKYYFRNLNSANIFVVDSLGNGWFSGNVSGVAAKFGSGDNFVEINKSGHLLLSGTAKVQKAIRLPISALALGSAAPTATLRAVGATGNVKAPVLSFSKTTTQTVHFIIEGPPDADDTTTVHQLRAIWIPGASYTSGDYCWKLETLLKKEDEDYGDSIFTTGTPTIYSGCIVPDNGASGCMESIIASGFNFSGKGNVYYCSLYRDVAIDDADDTAELIYIELDYQSDKLGSIM